MAGLGCRCGYGMSNINLDNDIELYVFGNKFIYDVMEKEELITLVDLLDIEQKYEYWKCPECGRIHMIDKKTNMRVRVYAIESDDTGEYDK